MVLDIAETENAVSSETQGKEKRFVFLAEAAQKAAQTATQKLTVYLPPEFSQNDSQTLEMYASAYADDLSRHTGIPLDCITVETGGESPVNFPCERKSANDLLAFNRLRV